MYKIQHCFIQRPSDSTVSNEAAWLNLGLFQRFHFKTDALQLLDYSRFCLLSSMKKEKIVSFVQLKEQNPTVSLRGS